MSRGKLTAMARGAPFGRPGAAATLPLLRRKAGGANLWCCGLDAGRPGWCNHGPSRHRADPGAHRLLRRTRPAASAARRTSARDRRRDRTPGRTPAPTRGVHLRRRHRPRRSPSTSLLAARSLQRLAGILRGHAMITRGERRALQVGPVAVGSLVAGSGAGAAGILLGQGRILGLPARPSPDLDKPFQAISRDCCSGIGLRLSLGRLPDIEQQGGALRLLGRDRGARRFRPACSRR